MKRLTIGADACTETLALLITMAWADGVLEEREKEGVRAASTVFNLTRELRERLDTLLEAPIGVSEVLVETLSARDRAFAFVAAAWMSGIDRNVDDKEKALLDEIAQRFGFTDARKGELVQVARDLEPLRHGKASWADELVALFKAIPARLEGDGTESVDVAFE